MCTKIPVIRAEVWITWWVRANYRKKNMSYVLWEKAQVCCFEWAAFLRCSERPNRTAFEVKYCKQVKLCNCFEQINMLFEWTTNKHNLHMYHICRAYYKLSKQQKQYPAYLHISLWFYIYHNGYSYRGCDGMP